MENPADRERQLMPVGDHSGVPAPRRVGSLVAALRAAAQPVPLEQPRVDPDLTTLSPIVRSAEVIRYSARRLEYWLSPRGELRCWFKLNVLVGLLLAIPVVVVAPIVTLFLLTMATWSEYLLATVVNMLLALLAIVGIVAILTGALFLFRLLKRH